MGVYFPMAFIINSDFTRYSSRFNLDVTEGIFKFGLSLNPSVTIENAQLKAELIAGRRNWFTKPEEEELQWHNEAFYRVSLVDADIAEVTTNGRCKNVKKSSCKRAGSEGTCDKLRGSMSWI